jgi:cytochrome c553
MCAACHSLDGIARLPDMPNVAGSAASYLARQLQAYKTGERKHEQMSIIAQGLSEEDIGDLAAWYSSIEVSAEMPQ